MADIEWDRVEPHTRLEQLEEGLQARVADPLWMLARQWQVGEFRGEDAASPIHARLKVQQVQVDSYRNEAVPGAKALPRGLVPLEAWAEAEPVTDGPAAIRLAAEAGLQLLRRLDAAGFGGLRGRLRERFPLRVDAEVLDGLPQRDVRRLELLARRGLDGRALLKADRSDLQALPVPAARRAELVELFRAWRSETQGRFIEPPRGRDAWKDERLEYSFSVAAQPPGGEVLLSAAEYPGGHLDWYAFDRADGALPPHGPDAGDGERVGKELDLLPIPLAYAGMPASRWWELEEGAVYFGGIEAGPADIGRLVVAEYATIYSDDWFLLPLRGEAGTLIRVQHIDVFDTFGGRHRCRSTAALDETALRDLWGEGHDKERAWTFWEQAGDPAAKEGKTPWLYLAPAVVAPLNGEPVEQVAFVRDEGANLAWGVESTIEGPTGRPLRRRLLWGLAQAGLDEAEEAEEATAAEEAEEPVAESDAWRYRLQTRVPPWWVPFLPERVEDGSAEMRLRRARMQAWEELDTRFLGAQGEILAPHRPLRLYEEEIPRGGVEVTRGWQLARGWAGRVHLWMARRKRPGRGERGSGLKFDGMKR